MVKNSLNLNSPVKKIRQGWAEACLEMKKKDDDKLIMPDSMSNQFDEEEWEW